MSLGHSSVLVQRYKVGKKMGSVGREVARLYIVQGSVGAVPSQWDLTPSFPCVVLQDVD